MPETVNHTMKKSEKIVNWFILILGVVMIAYYLLLGLLVRFGQSLQFMWLLAGLILIVRALYWFWAERRGRIPGSKYLRPLRIALAACVAIFLLVEGIILGAGFVAAPQGLDYIVVLGARVNGREPSGALRNRIQRAAEYLEANPDTCAVLSGGRGSDEEISEAQCMYENLIAMGIAPDRLILEDQSTDTSENLSFSRCLIPEGANVGLVTNNFHIFRSLALARGLGWEVSGVPVATSLISFPHYMMREFVGVVYDGLRGNLGFF